jgi:hypothetical protein
MSTKDMDWIVIVDELEDAQSVLSLPHSEDERVSSDDGSRNTESSCVTAQGHESREPMNRKTERTRSSLECIKDMLSIVSTWIFVLVHSSSFKSLNEFGIRRIQLTNAIITDHSECIIRPLGKVASAKLRGCGFVGCLYVPDIEWIIERQRINMREAWVGPLGRRLNECN